MVAVEYGVFADEKVSDIGPVEGDKDEIRQEPFSLPSNFMWDEICFEDDAQVSEDFVLFKDTTCVCCSLQRAELYKLLYENYVEDDDNMFRFDYSESFLQWALQPPGWRPSWFAGVRVVTSKKLVGFISAVPALIRIKGVYVLI